MRAPSPRTPLWICCLGLWLAIPALASARVPAGCAPQATSRQQILDVLQEMFAALRSDDLRGFRAQTTPDYYIFSGGHRYSAVEFAGVVKQAHDQGLRFEWSVTDPELHVGCTEAWLTYVNRGSIEVSSVKTPTQWLESAQMQFAAGSWHARFLHSTQVTPEH